MQAKPHKLVASECFFLLLCSSLEEIKFVVGSEFGLLIVWYWFLELNLKILAGLLTIQGYSDKKIRVILVVSVLNSRRCQAMLEFLFLINGFKASSHKLSFAALNPK